MTGSGPIALRRALTIAAVALGVLPSAASAGTWLSPRNLDSTNGSMPSFALDAAGNAFAAWQTNPTTPPGIVKGNYRAAGDGIFTALPDISTDTTPGHGGNTSPVVVTNRSGAGLVVWVDDLGGGNSQIQLRPISPGGSVGPVLTVGGPTLLHMSPTAAINASGDAVVAWERGNAIEAITRQGLNGTFTNTATPDVLDGTAGKPPSVAIDGSGNAIAVWETAATTVNAKRHPAGGPWKPADSLPAGMFSDPQAAASPGGQLAVVFKQTTGANVTADAVTGTVHDGWGAATPTVLSQAGVTHGPQVTVVDVGGAIAAWARGGAVEYALRAPGSAFPGPGGAKSITTVPTPPDNLALAGDGLGDAVVAWSSFETGPMQNVVRVAVKPAGGQFGATQAISDTSHYAAMPTITLDRQGDAIVAWSVALLGNPTGVGFAQYDAGPALGIPSIPSAATVGSSVAFSVAAPTDAFGSVVSTSWSFGDGSAAASGTSVTHTFAKVGTFTVSVTATDSNGQMATKSGSITVSAVTGPPPPPAKACKVPNMLFDTLGQARSALKKANCRLGTARAPKPKKHHKLGPLVVTSSSPGAGAVRPAQTKVSLVLEEVVTPRGNPFGLPVLNRCVARHLFHYAIHQPKGFGRVTVAYIYLNGKLVKSVTGRGLRSASIGKLPRGHFKVTVKALTTKRLVLISNRGYVGCKK